MNERIRELWIKAAKLESNPSWEGQTRFMERFALLIVRECAGIADEYDGVGSTIVSRIKQHFGVDSMSTEDKKTLIKELLGVKND
jgi:hypothetical protein